MWIGSGKRADICEKCVSFSTPCRRKRLIPRKTRSNSNPRSVPLEPELEDCFIQLLFGESPDGVNQIAGKCSQECNPTLYLNVNTPIGLDFLVQHFHSAQYG